MPTLAGCGVGASRDPHCFVQLHIVVVRARSQHRRQPKYREQPSAEGGDLRDDAVLDAWHIELERPELGVAWPAPIALRASASGWPAPTRGAVVPIALALSSAGIRFSTLLRVERMRASHAGPNSRCSGPERLHDLVGDLRKGAFQHVGLQGV